MIFLLHCIFLSSRIFLLWLFNQLCSQVSYDLKLKCSEVPGGQQLYCEFGISAHKKPPWTGPLGDLKACLKIESSLLKNSQGQDANLHLELSLPLMLFSLLIYLRHQTFGQISLTSKAHIFSQILMKACQYSPLCTLNKAQWILCFPRHWKEFPSQCWGKSLLKIRLLIKETFLPFL